MKLIKLINESATSSKQQERCRFLKLSQPGFSRAIFTFANEVFRYLVTDLKKEKKTRLTAVSFLHQTSPVPTLEDSNFIKHSNFHSSLQNIYFSKIDSSRRCVISK